MFMSGVSAFGVPADTSFLPDRVRFLSPSDTRFTMAATIFTAVDTAPRIIRMEINGVINPSYNKCIASRNDGYALILSINL